MVTKLRIWKEAVVVLSQYYLADTGENLCVRNHLSDPVQPSFVTASACSVVSLLNCYCLNI
jgi:hypothetical protein